ncbi:helix-turn-helix transcriptional regulator [Paenibacillus sp. BT-177]|uniref:helix-turn-helix transcriptional regulator n=1 Tax=Paenibacillus sp. BT-177 TaxID=2986930 RepID=UPI0021F6ACB0|nr:YafY family transcriptional regulator [Paenibacillus sp. BT-177]
MNKTDRLLAILLELQRKDIIRAEDLAAIFETSVRTIYRDIQALSESGVPIVGAPGIGYSLMEGYFLPPVSFTVEEAVALLIGTDFVEQKFDTDYGMKAQTSRRKIEAILPESVRREVAQVRTTIRLLAVGKGTNHTEKTYLETLRIAVLDKRKVRFGYSKKMPEADGNRQSVRVVAPYGLVLLHGSWVLIGLCELRQQLRHFRLSRMNDLIMLEDSYQLPIDFNLQDYKQADDRHINVHIQIRSDIVDKVKEANHFYMESMEEREDGIHVFFRVRHPEELLSWILGWGADVVVLEPESLRERVRTEVEKMLKCY